MKIIKEKSTGIGARVILAQESDGGYCIMTQQHRAIISPYCPAWEFMEDGWRPSIIEHASTRAMADKKYAEHIDRENRYDFSEESHWMEG